MHDRRTVRGMPVVGVAALGMVLGHWLAYLIAIPGANLRARVLADSGHAYWLSAVQAAIALAAVGLGAMAIRQLRARSGSSAADPPPRLILAGRLVSLQITMFVAVEAVERLAVREPLGQMFQHHVFFLGLVVQCLVAVAGAWFLRWFHRTVDRISEWVGRPHAHPVAVALAPSSGTILRPVPVLAGAAGLRSPPSR